MYMYNKLVPKCTMYVKSHNSTLEIERQHYVYMQQYTPYVQCMYNTEPNDLEIKRERFSIRGS